MSDQGHYGIGLDKTPANFVPLSPLSFIERTAAVYPNLASAVYGLRRRQVHVVDGGQQDDEQPDCSKGV